MSEELWTRVDRYVEKKLLGPDPVLEDVVAASSAAGLPSIAVSPAQGKLLHLLAKVQGARRILEIGTLGGYSTIWLARALAPGGRLVTLEVNPEHARVAEASFRKAGMEALIELRLGPAGDTLRQLNAEGTEPFDFVFIDADKPGYPEYLELVLPLCRPGSVIVADNVIRGGAVSDPGSDDPNVQGIRVFNDKIAANPRLSATALQTVGSKGYDGLAIVLVIA